MKQRKFTQALVSSRKPRKISIVISYARTAVILTNEPGVVMASEITAHLVLNVLIGLKAFPLPFLKSC